MNQINKVCYSDYVIGILLAKELGVLYVDEPHYRALDAAQTETEKREIIESWVTK